jgi:hypothetical protein
MYFFFDGFQLLEKPTECHAVLECLCGSGLYYGTVGQRVAERDTYLNKVDASFLHGQYDIGGAIEGGTACTEVEAEKFAIAASSEKRVNLVHSRVKSLFDFV